MRNVFKFMVLIGILLVAAPVSAQTSTVTGKVSDADGEPLIGVSVALKENKNIGTITDVDGVYSLQAVPDQTLVFSYIGYISREIAVGRQAVVNVVLNEDKEMLDEIIVVGYGTQKKSSLTGAISNIKSEDLSRTPSVTTSGALVGKVAGISARQMDGRPGATTGIQIRNLGTPLYVIDGMPSNEGQFNNLNTSDIESISVLKDGSAAIYGVRAANGVILVTTKAGKRNEKNTISASGYMGIQNFSRFPTPASAGEYVRAMMESDLNTAGSTNYTMEDLQNWQNGTHKGTDYYDAIVSSNAPIYYGNINASGGSEKSSYYLSLSHIDQQSLFKGYGFNRTNVQANFDIDVTKNLTVGTKINGRIEKRENVSVPGLDQDNYWGPYYAMFLNRPIETMYANNNPNYINTTSGGIWNPASFDRSIAGYTDDTWRVLQTNFFIDYKTPVKGLSARANVSYWYAHRTEDRHEYSWDAYTYNADADTYVANGASANSGWKRRIYNDVEDMTYQLQLNYLNSWGNHNLSTTLVGEAYKNKNYYYVIQGNPSNNYLYALDLEEMNILGDTFDTFTRAGTIFRASYDYASKYFLEVGGRYDASSLFRSGDNWGLFPSISAGWRISEEAFMKSATDTWLSNMKLRASYGQTGDDNNSDGTYIVAPYAYLEGYNWGEGNYVLNGKTYKGVGSRGMPTTTVSWMKSKIFNAGIDMDMFKNRLNFVFEYFNRKRTGIPAGDVEVVIPAELGFELPMQNLNSDSHTGVEGSIMWRDRLNEFNYQFGANFTFSRHKNNYVESDKNLQHSWDKYRNGLSERWSGITWGYETIGQFQSAEEIQQYPIDIDGQGNKTLLPGDLIYKDVNGDGKIDAYDERPIGYAGWSLPYLNFAFNMQVEWRGIDIKADFTGASFQSYMRQHELRVPLLAGGNNSPAFLITDNWHHEDPTDANSAWIAGKYPAIRAGFSSHSSFSKPSTFWLTNIRYLKLRTLEIGYSLPKHIVNRIGLENFRLYVNGYNVFSIDNTKDYGFDPEIGVDTALGTPTIRTFNIGFNLTF